MAGEAKPTTTTTVPEANERWLELERLPDVAAHTGANFVVPLTDGVLAMSGAYRAQTVLNADGSGVIDQFEDTDVLGGDGLDPVEGLNGASERNGTIAFSTTRGRMIGWDPAAGRVMSATPAIDGAGFSPALFDDAAWWIQRKGETQDYGLVKVELPSGRVVQQVDVDGFPYAIEAAGDRQIVVATMDESGHTTSELRDRESGQSIRSTLASESRFGQVLLGSGHQLSVDGRYAWIGLDDADPTADDDSTGSSDAFAGASGSIARVDLTGKEPVLEVPIGWGLPTDVYAAHGFVFLSTIRSASDGDGMEGTLTVIRQSDGAVVDIRTDIHPEDDSTSSIPLVPQLVGDELWVPIGAKEPEDGVLMRFQVNESDVPEPSAPTSTAGIDPPTQDATDYIDEVLHASGAWSKDVTAGAPGGGADLQAYTLRRDGDVYGFGLFGYSDQPIVAEESGGSTGYVLMAWSRTQDGLCAVIAATGWEVGVSPAECSGSSGTG